MLNPGDKAVLQFSGGADSTALLWMARPWLSQIEVLFVDSGDAFPHVKDHVWRSCETLGARLRIVRPAESVIDYTNRVGLPSDIVPIEATAEMALLLRDKPRQLLQSFVKCCSAMLWEPMQAAVKASGANVVLRGSKKSDAQVGVPDEYVEDGIVYRSPLWLMTDDDVAEYIRENRIPLPAHYDSVRSSLDCAGCSAFLAHHGAAKLRWMREHTPHLYEPAAERIRKVRETLLEHAGRIGEAMKEAS